MIAALHRALHDHDSPAGRRVETVVWVVVAFSLVIVGIDANLPAGQQPPRWLLSLDRLLLVLFAVEYILRVATARPRELDVFDGGPAWRLRTHIVGRVRYMLRPMSLVDLLAILAFVPALRGLRALRLLRLLRGVRLFRYSNPLRGVLRGFSENSLLYVATFGFFLGVVLLGGLSIFFAERGVNPRISGVSDGIWWAIVTVTTVGFGDITPVTALGRIVAAFVMIMGMFTLALFAGIVGSTLLHSIVMLREDSFRMTSHTNHVVVCGYSPSARFLLDALLEEVNSNEQEIVVFAPGERPDDLPAEFTWISGDPTRESELDKVRLAYACTALILGDRSGPLQSADASTILVVFTMRSYMKKQASTGRRHTPLYIVAEVLDPENCGHMRTSGADEVVETSRLGASLMAHAAFVHGSGTVMSRVAMAGAHSLSLQPNPMDASMPWSELRESLQSKHSIMLIGYRPTPDSEMVLNPGDDVVIDPGEELAYLAEREVFERADAL